MGKPKEHPERASFTIRIPKELHDRFLEACRERDLSMSWMGTKAIEQFLDRLIPVDEIKWTRD
jgi:predicted transcriptional regulator